MPPSAFLPPPRASGIAALIQGWETSTETGGHYTFRDQVAPQASAFRPRSRRELAMQKLVKLNGGEWFKDKGAWRLRSDLVDKLGLRNRVVRPMSSRAVAAG